MTEKTTNPETTFFIDEADDGWTLDGYIAAMPNVHREVRFKYRPCTPPERATVLSTMARMKPDAAAVAMCTALAKRIKHWNLTYIDSNRKVQLAPITEAYIKTMRHQIWDRLTDIVVYQSGGSDRDPLWDTEDERLQDDADFHAALTGQSPERAKLELLEGNSDKG